MPHPRLIAVGGPLEGRVFSLDGEVCVIGRHADCEVRILDVAVSRRHCEVRRDPAGPAGTASMVILDLESRCGTFVNGRPVSRCPLAHGDLIQIGTSVILYASSSSADDPAVADSRLAAHSTIERRIGDGAFPSPGRARVPGEDHARLSEELGALLELCTTAHRARGVARVAEVALARALALVPADRGCVLMADAAAGVASSPDDLAVAALRCAAARVRGSDTPAEFPVSRSFVERALRGRAVLLGDDVRSEAAAGPGPAPVRALLCAPLLAPDRGADPGSEPRDARSRALGALYLDAARPGAFTESHLELIAAVAAILSLALENALQLEWLRDENRRLRGDGQPGAALIGESPAMERLRGLIERIGATRSTVLIRGESGTGKELCARALHRASPRADGPFLAINCAVLSEALLESELFGHEKGAFTGAVARKLGKLETANGGTLFLDEVGELPVALQAKLLRVLQERELERVGGLHPIRVDVRVIAATNRDLEAAIRAGSFREDLYYRLNVIELTTPALRERRSDIPLLATHFARAHGARVGRKVVGISPEARDALCGYDWPGNVRQLSNAIERALVLGTDDVIRPEDLPDEILAGRPAAPPSGAAAPADPDQPFQDRILAVKRALIREAYERAGGDHQEAARRLGIHANSLHRLIRNLDLRLELGK